jgi:proton-dependent oligopeptide transporter, POT family
MRAVSADHKHSKETLIYILSRMFERAAYYGIRSQLVIYMISALALPQQEASQIYGWSISALIISQIIGAAIGDLLAGNKKALIIGGVLQAAAAFVFAIPSIYAFYTGLFLLVIGSGLYTPNLISHFGKQYLNKKDLLDAGFSMFYSVINFGALLGPFLVSLGGDHNYPIGFCISGGFMLISIALPVFNKEDKTTYESPKIEGKNIAYVLIALLIFGVFWGVYNFIGDGTLTLEMKFEKESSYGPTIQGTVIALSLIICGIASGILWSYVYTTQLAKITLGFLIACLAVASMLMIKDASLSSLIIYLGATFLISVAEILVSPILNSLLTQYSNPKYLAIIASIAFIPSRLCVELSIWCSGFIQDRPLISLNIGALILGIFGATLLITFIALKKQNKI